MEAVGREEMVMLDWEDVALRIVLVTFGAVTAISVLMVWAIITVGIYAAITWLVGWW